MKVDGKLSVILSLLIVLLFLTGFAVFRDYFIQRRVEPVEKTVYSTVTETMYSFLVQTTTVRTVSTEKVTVTVTSTATSITTAWKTGESVSCIMFRSNKDVYGRSEPVVLQLANNCGFNIVLPNSAPWLIIDSSGEIVFSPIAIQVITILKTGEVKEWAWEQKDSKGEPVPPGVYTVKLMTVNSGILSTTFRIE
jgi:hypothetical protein